MSSGKFNSNRLCLIATLTVMAAILVRFLIDRPWESNEKPQPAVPTQKEVGPDEPTTGAIDPTDTDGDGLNDEYEMLFAHSLSTSGDEDKDGLPDTLEEHYFSFTHVTDDEDKDGLPDRWEVKHFGHLNYGPEDNPDSDEWNNITERIRGHGYDPDEYTVITETTGDRRNGPENNDPSKYSMSYCTRPISVQRLRRALGKTRRMSPGVWIIYSKDCRALSTRTHAAELSG